MLNCRGPESRDDDGRRRCPEAMRRGPRQRDIVVGDNGKRVSGMSRGHCRLFVFASVNRALTTLNGRRQTDVRAGRREARLTVIYGRNSRILHKRLVERERERLGCPDGLPSSRSRLIPVYMTPGRGRALTRKGSRRIDPALLLWAI